MKGEVDGTKLQYIIRDHDRKHFEARKEIMASLANDLNEQYGEDRISVEIKDQYFNMREKLSP